MEINDEEMEDYYGSDYWPPPNTPPSTPPTPTYDYYKWSSSYYEEQGNMKGFDDYIDFYNEHSGKSVGQTSGMGEEDEFDQSYVDIPIGIRPSAPKALWNTVYSGLVDSKKYKGLQWVDCEEYCTDRVYVDKKSKKEDGTNKRPPMCHIIAYNHTKWAVEWLYNNKSHYLVGGTYKGPDMYGFDDDTWRKLVWHKSNLRPGHSKCNSKTASQAKGNPATSKAERDSITYVVNRLKKVKPNWF
jgi:hypothetical protein